MDRAWRVPMMMMLIVALALTACGGSAGGGGGGGGDDEDLPDRAAASAEDEEGTLYPLRAGRYRLSYRAPGCDDVVISITSDDFEYEQQPRGYTSFINDMPSGEYSITVVSDCDDWTINLNEF